MATLIKADGSLLETEPENGSDFRLEELQDLAGGYIEALYMSDGMMMGINEEGKLCGQSENRVATVIALENRLIFDHDFIAGDSVSAGMTN